MKKYGFTLAEMMISMLIMSVFFAATTRILTHKHPKEVQMNPHGFFECYDNGGTLYAHTYKESLFSEDDEPYETENCDFEPIPGITFINVHYLNTGNTRPYFNSQEPIFDRKIELSSPQDIQAYYSQYFDGTNDKLFADMDDFKTYLERSHSRSRILELWENGAVPPRALFISW